MSSENYGLAVEATRQTDKNVEEQLNNYGSKRSNVGYIIRIFGYSMVLLYGAALFGSMMMSYGIIF
jgi:hypothetical protein